MQLSVNALMFKQIGMAAAFNDLAIFHYHNFVSLLNRRETVSNNQRSAVFLQLVQRRLNGAL